jgi:hypothetical protein
MISDAADTYAILQSKMPLRGKNDDIRRREKG